jgi:hypothetical protein
MRIIDEEMVSDAKARQELGYAGRIPRKQGQARTEMGSVAGGKKAALLPTTSWTVGIAPN